MPKLPSGKKPLVSRNVRVELDTWEKMQQLADLNHETASDVVRRAIVSYVRRHESRLPKR